MKCDDCDGNCCENIILRYESGRALYKNRFPVGTLIKINNAIFTREKDLTWSCSQFKDGRCGDYENRPNLCKHFLCKKHNDYKTRFGKGIKQSKYIPDEWVAKRPDGRIPI